MPYKVKLKRYGIPIPIGFYNNCEFGSLVRDFRYLDQKYPQRKAYSISVSRRGSEHPPYDRAAFLDILSKPYQEQVKAFYVQAEFEAFIGQRNKIALDELERGDWYDDLENFDNIDFVIEYPEHYCIVELFPTNNIPKEGFRKYLLPFPWGNPDYPTSDSLDELEPILYLIYLGDGN